MADGDAHIILPPELRSIMGPENGPASRLGDPLPSRLPDDMPDFGDESEISIDLGDGVSIRIGDDDLAAPYIKETPDLPPFGENIARKLQDRILNTIGADIIQGVDADIASRSGWIDQYNKGIDLLGLKIEDVSSRSNRRNISRASHPLLIEAMVKYQAGAAAELLPAAGPVKVPTIGKVPEEDEQLAQAFQDDFNYYLTEIAKEYYPDTRSMLMRQGYCGIGYKKVYRCPIRRRPVSESVLAPDLIVSEEATDLDNANRVTHRIDMLKTQMRRMQIVGHYRDIQLGSPGTVMGLGGSANRKIKESEGISIFGFGSRPEDMPYEILECDITLDIDEYGIDLEWERGTPDGMPLPYKIAVERNSQQVLGMWRIWKPDDIMCMKQNCYIKFGFIPGLGFHDWGFLQLLGNQTRVLRSIWRLLIDAGMFANFPGGIKSKQARMPTNEIAPGPGEWPDVDIPAGSNLKDMLMPMPYKGPDPTLVQLSEIVKQDAMRLGNTTMLEVGEGRANTPVGTIMAILEDKVQVMADVFKNNHNSQKEELRKMRELFAENPQDLTLMCRERPRSPDAPYREWQRAEEFSSLNLVPASDPNVPSRITRLMVDNVLMMIAQQAPQEFDLKAVLRDVVTDIGKDPDRYLVRPENAAQPAPDPKVVAETIKQQTAQMKTEGEMKMQSERLQAEKSHLAVEAAKAAADNATTRVVAGMKRDGDHQQAYHDAAAQHLAPQPPVPVPTPEGGIGT